MDDIQSQDNDLEEFIRRMRETEQFASVFQKFEAKQTETAAIENGHDAENATTTTPTDSATSQAMVVVEGKHNNHKKALQQKRRKEAVDKEASKKQLKLQSQISVAKLKQLVNRPELVELHDITAKDPVFLLHMKSTKNSVPVPRHWNSKRRYLQGKRGYEKPPFQLPDFIKKTGIEEMRDSIQEKDSNKSLKAKTRERVQPKMGKIQMNYEQLHDAFFKWQTKPRITIHGDLYYEGKEFEKRFKKKPGELSNDLRRALGMPVGSNAHRYPPPWLAAMKRHGPPPSYPYLRIPGLNCPFADDDNDNDDDDTQSNAFETETNASDGED